MPYTSALRTFPPIPSAPAKVANADGSLSPEFRTFLTRLEAWAERVRAALDELEPP